MPYYSETELQIFGFKRLGRNVKVSKLTSIYNAEKISIDDNSRVDDFCLLSGQIEIGCNVHITPQCLLAGGEPGIKIEECATLAYGVKIFAQSDDYSGESMTNSLIPKQYKKEIYGEVYIGKFCILGANCVVLPGVSILEGCSIGAMSLVNKNTKEWSMYVGIPAKKYKGRSKKILELYNQYLGHYNE